MEWRGNGQKDFWDSLQLIHASINQNYHKPVPRTTINQSIYQTMQNQSILQTIIL